MITRRLLAWISYIVIVNLLALLLCRISPQTVVLCYVVAASFVFCFVIAIVLYEFTNQRIFTARINTDNKAVLVTGCDSGFGYYLAERLDLKGYKVFAGCLFPSKSGALELKRKTSDRLRIVQLDVTDDESVLEAKNFIQDNLGTKGLWALVNNAGVYDGFSVEFTDLHIFQKCLNVNVLGPVRVTKAFLPLIRQSKGRIVNVNSQGGRLAVPNFSAYCMSKFASIGFTEILRSEVDSFGVKVISIEPSFFATPLSHSKAVKAFLGSICSHLDKDILADYGQSSVDISRSLVEGTFRTASKKIEKVIDALEAAVSLQHPDSVYTVDNDLVSGMFMYTLRHLHRELLDLAWKIYKLLGWLYHKLKRS